MKIELFERAVAPDRDQEILDVLGHVAPSTFLLSLLQSTPDCVEVLSEDGRLKFVNQNGLDELMGGSLEEVRDTIWSAYWPTAARPALEEAFELALGGRHIQCRASRPREDDVERMWQVQLSPILDGAGQICGVLSLSRDVTANASHAPVRGSGEFTSDAG